MSPLEAFKLGFIARCVEAGLSPQQTQGLAKQAEASFSKQAEGGLADLLPFSGFYRNPVKATADTAKSFVDLAKSSVPLMLGLAAIPPTMGGAAAYLANKATDANESDLAGEVQQQELTDTYRRMAEQLRRQKQLRDYKQSRKRTGRVYM